MAVDLKLKVLEDCDLGYICPADNEYAFIGASREYIFYARWFQDGWHKQSQRPAFYAAYDSINPTIGAYRNTFFTKGPIDPSAFRTEPPDMECVSWGNAYSNLFLIRNQPVGQVRKEDVLFIEYYHGTISQEVTTWGSPSVVKWRDDGFYLGSYSPLFISFWLGCCCLPCFPCVYTGHTCKGLMENNFIDFTDRMDNYWDANPDLNPYPWDGFFVDFKGRIARGPEPTIGWVRQILFFPPDCNYCGCPMLACLIKNCMDSWFAYRAYSSKMFLFNENSGLPFKESEAIETFGKEMQDKFQFGAMDIKLNHFSDEKVYVGGLANFDNGSIGTDNKNVGVTMLGDYISRDGGGYDINESDYKEASFFYGEDGLPRISLIPVVTGSSDHKKLDKDGSFFRSMSVKNKSSYNKPEVSLYGWIYVDIPELIEKEKALIKFSYDLDGLGDGAIPDTATRNCPNMGCDLPRTLLDMRPERFLVKSQFYEKGEKFFSYGRNTHVVDFNETPLFPMHEVEYYKRLVFKVVKAPHNLYLKSGETSFRKCILGETLKNLEPGRYYFPSAGCSSIFTPAGDFEESIEVPFDKSEGETEFAQAFKTKLKQYDANGKITDPKKQLSYAKGLLGDPYDPYNSIMMESVQLPRDILPQKYWGESDPRKLGLKLIADSGISPSKYAELHEKGWL
jgi:hypothetical protein